MNCKQTEKKIEEFLNDDLDNRTLRQFLRHIDSCPDCKEELSIQFLVTEGLNALENGDTYDLNNSLKTRLERSRREINISKKLFWTRNITFITVLILTILLIFFMHLYL